ncbi:MAG TPA: hypothetical protein VGO62_08310 [Myxococcota bacterium]
MITLMSPMMMMTFAYLAIGLGTTMAAWVAMPDEIEMAIGFDLDDEEDRPALRYLVTVLFVISWPVLLAEVLKKR